MIDWERLKELLYDANKLHGQERESFLKKIDADNSELGRELRSLLEYTNIDDEVFVGPVQLESEYAADSLLPRQIGPYTIDRIIGRGGMGRVYLAHQTEPIARSVAIKVIKPGMDSESVLRRFRNERRTLAKLQHPNISRVLDAGVDERERPYVVMELVDGPTITDFALLHHLSVEERIGLFQHACNGVSHAHAKGMIHRDLKPNNILVVTEGGESCAKIIDFGIAAVFSKSDLEESFEPTNTKDFRGPIGTIHYMSPENAAGERIDTRSDVYSLGVILYQLMTGVLPHNWKDFEYVSPDHLYRFLNNSCPVPPSRVTSTFDNGSNGSGRELDWICLKAIESDPERRYQSAEELKDDLSRFLNGEVVKAVPPSRTYRARKWIQRNQLACIAILGMALVGAIISATSLNAYYRIRDSQKGTETALVEMQSATDYLENLITNVDPFKMGPDVKLKQVLDEAHTKIDSDLDGAEKAKARIRRIFGIAYTALNEHEKAEALFDTALVETASLFGSKSIELASLHIEIAILHNSKSEIAEMFEHASASENILYELQDQNPELLLQAKAFAGRALAPEMDLEKGIGKLVEASEYAKRNNLDSSLMAFRTGVWLAEAQRWAGRQDKAVEELLDLRERLAGIDSAFSWEVESSISRELGAIFLNQGKRDDAISEFDHCIKLNQDNLGLNHRNTISLHATRAVAVYRNGDKENGLNQLKSAIGRLSQAIGSDAARVMDLQVNYFGMLLSAKKYQRVRDEIPQFIPRIEKIRGTRSMQTASAKGMLGVALTNLGELEEGIDALKFCIDVFNERKLTKMPVYRSFLKSYIEALEKTGNGEAATKWRESLDLAK